MRSVLINKITSLILIFCLSLFFSSLVEGDPKTDSKTSQQKTRVVKKQNKSQNSKLSCPEKVNQALAKKLIADWMQAEMWGQTRPIFAKKSCLDKKTQYRLMLPNPQRDVGTPTTPIIASNWKLLSLKKTGENKFSTDYIAGIRITGKVKNKSRSFSQKMLFGFPKGMEAKAFGCVMLHSGWKENFISKQCFK